MNPLFQKLPGAFGRWAGDGPWRSKSVLAALALAVVGMGFWFSELKSNPATNETSNLVTNAPGGMPSNPASAPAGAHWDWSKPFPVYGRLGASYVAGFCIGWFLRKLKQIVLAIGALIIALLAFGKFAGCDTAHMQEQVKHGGEWAQHETTAAENYLKHLLPSATAGGAGVFLGFRRRSKAGTAKPAA